MAFTREFLAFLTSTAIIMVCHCEADPYPPPTGLSHEWLDKFTVKMSWNKPSRLLNDSNFKFLIESTHDKKCVEGTTSTEKLFTKEINSDGWTYNISTVRKECDESRKSTPATITIQPPKPKAELVEDFRCIIQSKAVNCTWKPLDPSQALNLSYRTSGRLEEDRKRLNKCGQFYSSGERKGCYLPIDTDPDNIWILIETSTAMSTFEPKLEVVPPNLTIKEEGNSLKVNWTHEEAKASCWIAEICYKQCDKDMGCQNTSTLERMMPVSYIKGCLYEFRSRIVTTNSCTLVTSEQSEVITYGANNPDRTLTVIAIVVPVVLSICVILSCYCFRRHSAIICPTIPDPSAIFKEMMMNGSKDGKTTAGNLYKPVPESIESCKITLVTDSSDLQQNS